MSITVSLKKILAVVAIVTLIAAVPFTISQLRKQQEIRQRATGGQVSLYFTRTTTPTPLSRLALTPGQEVSLRLFLNAGDDRVNGFDVTLSFEEGLTLTNVVEGAGAARFNTPLFNNIDNQGKTFHFAKVTNTPSSLIGGTLHLATLTFSAGEEQAAGNMTLTNVTVTSPTQPQTGLGVSAPALPYTIAVPSPTPTPTPTISGPTLTLTVPLQAIGQGQQGGLQGPARNASPRTTTRTFTVFLFDQNERAVDPQRTISGTLTFSPGDFLFRGSIGLGPIPSGSYSVKIKTPRYLRRRLPGIITIPPNPTVVLPQNLEMIVGDVNNDNEITIDDYNVFQSCFANQSSCTPAQRVDSDFNDDGTVDLLDYRFLFESFRTQRGD